jgi:hypothetical protein
LADVIRTRVYVSNIAGLGTRRARARRAFRRDSAGQYPGRRRARRDEYLVEIEAEAEVEDTRFTAENAKLAVDP